MSEHEHEQREHENAGDSGDTREQHDNDREQKEQREGKIDTIEQARERIAALEKITSETNKDAANWRKKHRQLEGELTSLREESMGEQEKAIEQARREEREKVTRELRTEIVAAEVQAIAGSRFRDSDDALRHIDLVELVDVDDTNARKRSITRALEQLLEAKPYLAVDNGTDTSRGARTQGVRTRMSETSSSKDDDSDWLRSARRRGRT